ncbi:hypothetical protein FOS14_06275 [Skermania sp. ID1734]|nr:hypothetical protein FOS14_06275 [Skermania sp. ID1734]
MLGILFGVILVPVGTATASPVCQLYPGNPAATIDALRFACSTEQTTQFYLDAAPGPLPQGHTNGWVVYPKETAQIAPGIWTGKNFYGGGFLQNRLTGANIEGWPAHAYIGTSMIDGKPTWILDYSQSPTPRVVDEIREITPGVWFGYSFVRTPFGLLGLLSFVLA